MKKIVFSFSTLLVLTANAQKYLVSTIKPSLIENADAVLRNEEFKLKVYSTSQISVNHKWAITVLNPSGDDYAKYISYYDKFEGKPDVSGSLYNKEGKEVKSLKRKEVIDRPVMDGMSLATDGRIKEFQFSTVQYPYTVEFEEEQDINQSYQVPKWSPVEGKRFSVENSLLIVEVPLDFKLRYRQLNLEAQPQIQSAKSITYTWNLKNFNAVNDEALSPQLSSLLPMVLLGTSDFKVDKYSGNMDSWMNLGKFVNLLNKDRDNLPDNIKADIHKLTDNIKDTAEKVKVLYNYLQQSTRYISIQKGIGGWQPFDATYVATNKYGDCKALSNYMISMLKEARVPARYVLINAGPDQRSVLDDFPTAYFNHAIACVPMQKDTMWLECTSQTVSPGFMGSFTGNRNALLVDEEGGHLVKTPVYKMKDNLVSRNIIANVDESGSLIAEVKTIYNGISQELPHELLHGANTEQRTKYLNRSINLPTYSIDNVEYTEKRAPVPQMIENIKLTAQNYATVMGKRMFILPNILNRQFENLSQDKERILPINIKYDIYTIDSIEINIPAGFIIESIPANVHLVNKFGSYDVNYKVNGNSINLFRIFKIFSNTYPPSQYKEFADYYNNIIKADNSRLVFIKKDV